MRDLPAARRARTHATERKTRLGRSATPSVIDRNTARPPGATRLGTPSPGGVRAEHPKRRRRRERDEMRAPGLARSPARSSATRDAQGLQRLQRWGGADLFARMRAVRAERSPFGLRLRNRAFVTKGTCDARGRRAAKVSDVAARRVSRRGTSGGCALAIWTASRVTHPEKKKTARFRPETRRGRPRDAPGGGPLG